MSDVRVERVLSLLEQEALDKINPVYAAAVIKYDYESYSYIECAKILGCKINTFKQRLRRGRRNMTKEIQRIETERGLR